MRHAAFNLFDFVCLIFYFILFFIFIFILNLKYAFISLCFQILASVIQLTQNFMLEHTKITVSETGIIRTYFTGMSRINSNQNKRNHVMQVYAGIFFSVIISSAKTPTCGNSTFKSELNVSIVAFFIYIKQKRVW